MNFRENTCFSVLEALAEYLTKGLEYVLFFAFLSVVFFLAPEVGHVQWNDKCPPDCGDDPPVDPPPPGPIPPPPSDSGGDSDSGDGSYGTGYFPLTTGNVGSSDKPRSGNYIPKFIIPESLKGARGSEGQSYLKAVPYDSTNVEKNHPWNPYNKKWREMWDETPGTGGGVTAANNPVPSNTSSSSQNPVPGNQSLLDDAAKLGGDSWHILHNYIPAKGTPEEQLFVDCLEPRVEQGYCEMCGPWVWPGFIDPWCKIPFVNTGVVLQYWWPTVQIEINNFGISALKPDEKFLTHDTISDPTPLQVFTRKKLVEKLKAKKQEYLSMMRDSYETQFGTPMSIQSDTVSSYSPIGSSLTSAETSNDQSLAVEAHLYQTYLNHTRDQTIKGDNYNEPGRTIFRNQGWGRVDYIYKRMYGMCVPFYTFLYNGFVKGNPESCFYDTLEHDSDVPKVWTEHEYFRPFWLYPPCSTHMDMPDRGGLYEGSVPSSSDIKDSSGSWLFGKSCASWRSMYGVKRMRELAKDPLKFKFTGDETKLRKNCYQSGWQLYPLVGMDFSQSSLTGPAITIRRAAELGGQRANCNLTTPEISTYQHLCTDTVNPKTGIRDHVNKFTRFAKPKHGEVRTEVDKIQILFPRVFDDKGVWITKSEGYDKPSRCMPMNKVEDLLHKQQNSDALFAKHKGTVRYVIWERRRACFCPYRGFVSDPERYNGPDPYTDRRICPLIEGCKDQGWGCRLYPRHDTRKGRGDQAEEPNKLPDLRLYPELTDTQSVWTNTSSLCATTPKSGTPIWDVPYCCYYPYIHGKNDCEYNYGYLMMRPERLNVRQCIDPKCEDLDSSKQLCEMKS